MRDQSVKKHLNEWEKALNEKEKFQQKMEPWPDLKPYGKKIEICNGDLRLFVYETGKGNPISLVMIHGLGDEADTWRHTINPLRDDFHIIAVDLPGFGRSDLPERKITGAFLLDCLSELLEVSEIENAVLIGNSLGGELAHAFALKYPERVDGLVLVDGALLHIDPMGDLSFRLMQIPLLGEWLYKRLRKDPQAAFDSLRNVYHELDEMPEADKTFLFTRVNKRVWSDKQSKAFFSTLRNLSSWVKNRQANLSEKLKDFQIPTLIIRGEFDSLFTKKNAKGVERVQPNAIFVEIKNAGHLPHQEVPEVFLKVLREWLQNTLV